MDEFYNVQFSLDDKFVIVAGKSKDKKKWDDESQDYQSCPPSIKVCAKFTMMNSMM